MINYTTPTIPLEVKGLDLSSFEVYVTLEQGGVKLTKSGGDLTITTQTVQQVTSTFISFMLTQLESAMFNHRMSVDIQVNWIKEGVRKATDIQTIEVMRNLLDEVVEDD